MHRAASCTCQADLALAGLILAREVCPPPLQWGANAGAPSLGGLERQHGFPTTRGSLGGQIQASQGLDLAPGP